MKKKQTTNWSTIIVALAVLIFISILLTKAKPFTKAGEIPLEKTLFTRIPLGNNDNCLKFLGSYTTVRDICYRLFAVTKKEAVADCQCFKQEADGSFNPFPQIAYGAVNIENFCPTVRYKNPLKIAERKCQQVCEESFPDYSVSRPINFVEQDYRLSFCENLDLPEEPLVFPIAVVQCVGAELMNKVTLEKKLPADFEKKVEGCFIESFGREAATIDLASLYLEDFKYNLEPPAESVAAAAETEQTLPIEEVYYGGSGEVYFREESGTVYNENTPVQQPTQSIPGYGSESTATTQQTQPTYTAPAESGSTQPTYQQPTSGSGATQPTYTPPTSGSTQPTSPSAQPTSGGTSPSGQYSTPPTTY